MKDVTESIPSTLAQMKSLTGLGDYPVQTVFELFAENADDDGLLSREAFWTCFYELIRANARGEEESLQVRAASASDASAPLRASDAAHVLRPSAAKPCRRRRRACGGTLQRRNHCALAMQRMFCALQRRNRVAGGVARVGVPVSGGFIAR
jgi:hypothetical protein